VQWEEFLRHVVEGAPFPYTLLEGAKGVQLAEAGLRSWRERRWIDMEPLSL
jgi:predicted dehydrogenase